MYALFGDAVQVKKLLAKMHKDALRSLEIQAFVANLREKCAEVSSYERGVTQRTAHCGKCLSYKRNDQT